MGKRSTGYYPSDPYMVEALRLWLARRHPAALRQEWVDPCAGYGALLAGLVAPELRHAIEVQPALVPELMRRVPRAHLRIGDGLALPWRPLAHVAENPPFDHETMAAFVRRALEHRHTSRGQALVCAFGLATFWQSEGLATLGRMYQRPDWILALGFRASCDGSGVGDMRAQGWMVWDGSHTEPWSRHVVLPRPAVSAPVLAEHRRLSLLEVA